MRLRSRIIHYSILFVICLACKREEFDTPIIASLDAGIPKVLFLPCPLVISKHSVYKNEEEKSTTVTLYTDSFGYVNKHVKLPKLKRKEFYEIEPLETMWQVPVGDAKPLIAGIENNLRFDVRIKWRYDVYLMDSAGIYEPTHFSCGHTMSRNYSGINQSIDSFPLFGMQTIMVSAPSYSYINVYMYLKERGSSKKIQKKWTFNSMPVRSLWIVF